MSIQVKGDLNEANRDHIEFKKWEWKIGIVIAVVFIIGTIVALKVIYNPLLG